MESLGLLILRNQLLKLFHEYFSCLNGFWIKKSPFCMVLARIQFFFQDFLNRAHEKLKFSFLSVVAPSLIFYLKEKFIGWYTCVWNSFSFDCRRWTYIFKKKYLKMWGEVFVYDLLNWEISIQVPLSQRVLNTSLKKELNL